MKLLVLNGPNLNLLGLREPELYGTRSYADLCAFITAAAQEAGVDAEIAQTNYEGAYVEWIQKAYGRYAGLILNPAAYTHTSIAILDALRAVALPAVEVHLTDIDRREPFRKISYVGMACLKTYAGLGFEGYRQAILYLKSTLSPAGRSEE